MCQPYIEDTTVLADYIDDEEIARISWFCQAAEIDFQSLAGPTNMSIQVTEKPFTSK